MVNKDVQKLISELGYSKIIIERGYLVDRGWGKRESAYRELSRRGVSVVDDLCQALGDTRTYSTVVYGRGMNEMVGDNIAQLLANMGMDVIPHIKKHATNRSKLHKNRSDWILCQFGDLEACFRFSDINTGLEIDLSKMSIHNDDKCRENLLRTIVPLANDGIKGEYIIEEWGFPKNIFNQLAKSLPTDVLIKLQIGQGEIVSRNDSAFEPLINALKTRDKTSLFALDTLQKMGYSPQNDSDGLLYYLVSGDFDSCLDYGSDGVEILIRELERMSNWGREKARGYMESGDYKALQERKRSEQFPSGLPMALAKSDDPKAIEALIKQFTSGNLHPELPSALSISDDPRVLDAAIEQLIKGNKSPALIELLVESDSPKALDAMINRHYVEVVRGTLSQFNPTLPMMLAESKNPKAINMLKQTYSFAISRRKTEARIYTHRGKDNRVEIIGEALRQVDNRPRSLLDKIFGSRGWAR